MINRSLRVSMIVAGTLIAGVFTAPAFGQSYGAVPRGACLKAARVSYAPPMRMHPQPVVSDAGDSAPVRQSQRPRRTKGFPSPF